MSTLTEQQIMSIQPAGKQTPDTDTADATDLEFEPTVDNQWEVSWGVAAKKLLKCAQSGSQLDIYQVASVMWILDDEIPRWQQFLLYFRAVWAAVLQLFTVFLFVWNGLRNQEKAWCDGEGEWEVRAIAVIGMVFISLKLWSMAMEQNKLGLYEHASNCPPFVSRGWLWFGVSMNWLALLGGIYGSLIFMFFSDDALDVFLNCLAFLLVVECDNVMVNESDYERIAAWLETDYKSYWQAHGTDQLPQLKGCEKCYYYSCSYFFFLALYLTVVVCLIAPFYTLYCF